ncbi:MAG TPA: 16S rRNA (adenine(1518)-N(6)/adenine(1519)-N(6))-dimethyltransferase RsmA [Puia sp.]|nr:16S rRNA (adenine(1518)-N(6)/adenine(1519)-N(6))-dimethyltransferase RsmA [Puia sp.]
MYTLKKSLGQHFLRDENVARKIVAAVTQRPKSAGAAGQSQATDVSGGPAGGEDGALPFTRLLEVGPGGGALTGLLLGLPGIEFRAVELDDEKVSYLQKTWPALEGKIIHASILDIDPPFTGAFTVIGNFPYNISSQILFKMVDWKEQLETMVGMFQKEVAQRVAASPGNKTYGVLSVLIQAFFTVEYLFEVHEQCFNPPPKVKSAVIRLTPRQAPAFRDERRFTLLVKTAFNQRRKTLRNAVRSLFDEAILRDPVFDRRAEQLTIEEFAQLSWKMR